MVYQIASQWLRVDCPPELRPSLQSLTPYEAADVPDEPAARISLLRFRFPQRMIPAHRDDYSGFLIHPNQEQDKPAFVFCFREGTLLYGMQQEQDGSYNVYIHSWAGIACKTALQYILLLQGCRSHYLGFHAVTITQEGHGILLSAPSGTGKTTHSELWRQAFGTRILNGDFAMLRCEEDAVIFDGTPFCGSSPYAERGQWPVTDVVFLRQAPHNRIRRISRLEAITNTMENCFLPRWDEECTRICMGLIGTLLKNVRAWQLECNMDPEAAHVARAAIMAADADR